MCETVVETRRLTRVSAVGLVTFTRVSVAAVTAEPYHFFICFRQVSVGGNTYIRSSSSSFEHNMPAISFLTNKHQEKLKAGMYKMSTVLKMY